MKCGRVKTKDGKTGMVIDWIFNEFDNSDSYVVKLENGETKIYGENALEQDRPKKQVAAVGDKVITIGNKTGEVVEVWRVDGYGYEVKIKGSKKLRTVFGQEIMKVSA